MKLPAIVTSDLHLTANPRDAYRWELFPWLVTQCKQHKVKTLLILGDLTDAKDFHSSTLVNQVADALNMLTDYVEEIIILMGNHDYLKNGEAFFQFLNHHPQIRFITKIADGEDGVLYLPHSKEPSMDWDHLDLMDYDYIFMHQTVDGSVSENGQKMSSSLSSKVNTKALVFSGDIHVPQVIGDIMYVGSPYPVRFGDTFKARCLLVQSGFRLNDLYFETIKRAMLDIDNADQLRASGLCKGDQAKIRINLTTSNNHVWHTVRREVEEAAKEMEVEIVSLELKPIKNRKQLYSGRQNGKTLSHEQRVMSFVEDQDLGGDLLDAGLDIVEGKK